MWLMGDLSRRCRRFSVGVRERDFSSAIAMIYLTAFRPEFIARRRKKRRCISGVDVRKVQIVVYLTASLLLDWRFRLADPWLCRAAVPHVMRMIFGTDYRILLPAAHLGARSPSDRGYRRANCGCAERVASCAITRLQEPAVYLFVAAETRVNASRGSVMERKRAGRIANE